MMTSRVNGHPSTTHNGSTAGTAAARSALTFSSPIVLVGQACVLLATLLHIRAANYLADDGFISLRYAQHLAEGHGLVYNIGERVEGYTNFLWVVMLAAAKWLLPSLDLVLAARVLGVIAAVLTVLLAFRFAAAASLGPVVGLLAGAFLAAHSSFVAWAPAGLETSLFVYLVFAAAVSFVADLETRRYRPVAPLLLGLAALTRPDGALIFAATGIALVLREWPVPFSAAGVRRAVVVSLRFALPFLLIYVPHLLWRHSYYGDWVPNTAYAKVGSGFSQVPRGLRYLWNYAIDYGVFVWLLPVALYVWRSRERWLWYFLWVCGLYLAYVLYVGGDGLAFHRFVAHIAPLIYTIVAAALVDGYRRYVRPRAASLAPALGLAGVAVVLWLTAKSTLVPVFWPDRVRWTESQSGLTFPGDGRQHSYVWFDNYFVDRLTAAGRYLDANAPDGTVIASTPAGAVAYATRHRVIDMLGLNDRHIARTPGGPDDAAKYGRAGHEKGDGAYVLSLAPDYILMGNVAVLPYPVDEKMMARKLVLKSEHELWALPAFHERYELVTVRLAADGPFQYFTFFRKR